MNSMGEKHVIFLCLSLFSLPRKLETEAPSFPDPISLRFDFWKKSKRNRHLLHFWTVPTFAFKAWYLEFLFSLSFFPPQKQQIHKLFLCRLGIITIIWSKKCLYHNFLFSPGRMCVMVSWSENRRQLSYLEHFPGDQMWPGTQLCPILVATDCIPTLAVQDSRTWLQEAGLHWT